MPLASLFRRRPFEREAALLYGAAVSAAREPAWYATLGVPDTLDGRFDMVSLFAFLLIDRARTEPDARGGALAQAVFDAMFSDMDETLREMGVGDLSVGSKVRVMWEAFNGRARAYAAALESDGGASPGTALEAALGRNVWRGAAPPGAAGLLAGAVLRERAHLAGQRFADLAAGRVSFLGASAALAAP